MREPIPIRLAEAGLVPEALLRLGIRFLVRRRLKALGRRWDADSLDELVEELSSGPIAPAAEAANREHYLQPPEFFRTVLGPRMKYSSAFWPAGVETLAEAEEAMLAVTCRRAQLEDGHRVLDLGCGWGALSLWITSRYPGCRVTAVSNSPRQIDHLREEASRRGVADRIRAVRADVAEYRPARRFHRILSVEMFEHLRDYRELMERLAAWLVPRGRLFVHVFSHRRYGYPYSGQGRGAWMGRNFFTGGLMPAHDLLPAFDEHLTVEESWRIPGTHYRRTAEAWKENLDASERRVVRVFDKEGEPRPVRQVRRWRLFFLAVAELFGFRDGTEWGVSHYRFLSVER